MAYSNTKQSDLREKYLRVSESFDQVVALFSLLYYEWVFD